MRKLVSLVLIAVLMLSCMAVTASATEVEDVVCAPAMEAEIAAGSRDANTPLPYAWTHAKVMSDKLTMGGKSYYDGILFDTGTLNGPGIISYNFEGLYSSLSFDASFVDGGLRNATMTITADGVVVYEEKINYEDAVKSHTISLEGVRQLTIQIYSRGENTAEYGIGKIKAVPKGSLPEKSVRTSCENYNDCQYVLKQAKVKTGKFEMGGYTYKNGYLLDGSTLGGQAKIGFNFDGKYDKLSFDIAKYMGNVNDTRAAYLTIEMDGEAVKEYDERKLLWNDLCLPVELDLTGVKQVVIKFTSRGEYVQTWAIGNVQIEGGLLPAPEQTIKTTPMYRLYNPNTGEHFYTGSEAERDTLKAAGWHYEGIAWNAPTNSGAPVYRMYNPNTGDHHYTMSQDEVDMLKNAGWKYEGVCWNSASADNEPLYRLYNPNAICGSHHYTGSTEERDFLVSVGWHYEGIGWYGIK